MSYQDALNIILLYQDMFELLSLEETINHMLTRDRTELFPLEQTALQVYLKANPLTVN